MDYKLGTHLYIQNAGKGAWGCNNATGIVVSSSKYEHGLLKSDEGFLIKLDDDNNIWKVNNKGCNSAHYEILS